MCARSPAGSRRASSHHEKKLDDWSTPMVFIRYETGSKVYRFYNLNTEHVQISHDMVFDELKAWKWGNGDRSSAMESEIFHVETMAVTLYHGDQVGLEQEGVADVPSMTGTCNMISDRASQGCPCTHGHDSNSSDCRYICIIIAGRVVVAT